MTFGYTEAIKRLEEEYGDPTAECDRIVQELRDRSRVRGGDPDSWKELQEAMENCYNNMRCFGRQEELNHPCDIMTFAFHLPPAEQRDWTKRYGQITREYRTPTFLDLLAYVKDCQINVSTRMAQGVRENLGKKYLNTQRVKTAVMTVATRPGGNELATKAKNREHDHSRNDRRNQKLCFECNGDHPIYKCQSFHKKSQTDRFEIIRKYRLCMNCLLQGHTVKECRNELRCRYQNCGGKHHTLLHREKSKSTPSEPSNTGVIKTNCAQTGFNTNMARIYSPGSKYMPVVPLRVTSKTGKQAEVWGFIDEGSSTSFCHEKLIGMLGLETTDIRYQLQTMNYTGEVKAYTVDLRIEGLSGEYPIKLTGMPTIKSIPVQPNDYPKQSELDKYPHLRGIQLPSIP